VSTLTQNSVQTQLTAGSAAVQLFPVMSQDMLLCQNADLCSQVLLSLPEHSVEIVRSPTTEGECYFLNLYIQI
jgi:hypothetical protein